MDTSYRDNFQPIVSPSIGSTSEVGKGQSQGKVDTGMSFKITNNILKDEIAPNSDLSPSTLSSAANTMRVAQHKLPSEIPSAQCALVNALAPKKTFSKDNLMAFKPGDLDSFKSIANASDSKCKKMHNKGLDFAPYDDKHIYVSEDSGINEGAIHLDDKGITRTVKYLTQQEKQEFHSFLNDNFTFLQKAKERDRSEEKDLKFTPFYVKRSHLPLDIAVSPNSNQTVKHFVTNESRSSNSLKNELALNDAIQKHDNEKDIQKKEVEKERLKKEVLRTSINFCYNQFSTQQTALKNQSLELGEKKATPILKSIRAA